MFRAAMDYFATITPVQEIVERPEVPSESESRANDGKTRRRCVRPVFGKISRGLFFRRSRPFRRPWDRHRA
jgi:hypothetical protein